MLDERPIFSARLVAESGCSTQGMPADAGRLGIAIATRSFTSWRASRLSVPRLKKRVIADSPGTVFDRMTSSPGVLFSDCSIGIVISCSTSSVDMPSPSVCTSTNGGANSGKTSTGMSRTRVAPKTIMPTPSATTMKRNCRLDLTIQRIIGLRSWLTRLRSGTRCRAAPGRRRSRPPSRSGAALEDGDVPVDLVDLDRAAHERERPGARVHPGAAVDPVDDRRVGDGLLRLPPPGRAGRAAAARVDARAGAVEPVVARAVAGGARRRRLRRSDQARPAAEREDRAPGGSRRRSPLRSRAAPPAPRCCARRSRRRPFRARPGCGRPARARPGSSRGRSAWRRPP